MSTFLRKGWMAFAVAAVLPLLSCEADPVPAPQEEEKPEQKSDRENEERKEPLKPETTGSKTLVIWYSFTGNSKSIVTALRSHLTADALEVKPAEEGLDYAANNYAIGGSLISAIRENPTSASSYPAIQEVAVSFADYDSFMIVTPLWWSRMAAPMQTFLFQYGAKMEGKSVGLIVTSASSSISGVEEDAKRLVPHGNFLPESLWIRSSQVGSAAQMTKDWYEKMFRKPSLNTSMKVSITAGGRSFSADIEDSATGKAFLETLPMTLQMSELNGNEKYCYGISLPRSDQHYGSIAAGDLMLYSGNCIVLFYGAAGGYSYTRIGRITDVTGLAAALGSGSVPVTFERSE